MKYLSPLSLLTVHWLSFAFVCGGFIPFIYFGEAAAVTVFSVGLFCWIESDIERARRTSNSPLP